MRERAEALTRELLSWPSVTGSQGERDFGPRLHALLARWPYFAEHPEHLWMEDAGDGRFTVCALVRGDGPDAAILAGHYDVVDVEEYGALDPGDPDALRAALVDRVPELASPDWMPGRGALDMKSGLAAALTVLERRPGKPGSVLLVACPDEEAHSAGARAAARVFPRVAAEHGLTFRLGINHELVTGGAEYGRQVFCGCVGKVLLCALIRGRPTHVGESHKSVSAHALAAEVIRRVEARTDWAGGPFDDPSLPPPVLLHGGDLKTAYDVTMPRDVLLMFNLILLRETPARALDAFAGVVGDALGAGVPILRGDVPASDGDPVALARGLAATELEGPGAVAALGSVRYAAVPFNDAALRGKLEAAAGDVKVGGAYPHVSDVSFLSDGVTPWVNAGPWGHDFHQVTERVHTPYAFGELPGLIERLLATVL